jgi:hypothetical protein
LGQRAKLEKKENYIELQQLLNTKIDGYFLRPRINQRASSACKEDFDLGIFPDRNGFQRADEAY